MNDSRKECETLCHCRRAHSVQRKQKVSLVFIYEFIFSIECQIVQHRTFIFFTTFSYERCFFIICNDEQKMRRKKIGWQSLRRQSLARTKYWT